LWLQQYRKLPLASPTAAFTPEMSKDMADGDQRDQIACIEGDILAETSEELRDFFALINKCARLPMVICRHRAKSPMDIPALQLNFMFTHRHATRSFDENGFVMRLLSLTGKF
jgi:hypothetical protein